MKKHTLKTLLVLLFVVSLISCEKYTAVDEFDNKEANSTLIIRTRAVTAEEAEGEAQISYPVNIYVFNDNDRCVKYTTINSEDEELSLNLPEGSYDVYAIAGANAEKYNLPTESGATKETAISLKEGSTHGDIMTANNKVSLAYGEENKLTLSLERKVMLLESIKINDVPDNITGVTVSLAPLYSNILLNGEYSGEDGEYTATLTKNADGTTWESTGNVYLLEAPGNATVKISFTANDGTHSFSYTSPEELKANYKVRIEGTYVSGDLNLSGTITGTTWAGTKDVTFTFNESGSSVVLPDEGGETEDETQTGEVPEVGTLYNGCYVLRTESQSDGHTLVTLMSVEENAFWNFENDDETSVKIENINLKLNELATKYPEFTGWSLAELEDEMKYITANLTKIEEDLKSLGLKDLNTNALYLCENSEGLIQSYNVKSGYYDSKITNSTSTILRIFTTIKI